MKFKLAALKKNPEIFHSIQGEGLNLGRPSIFIRSSFCNLHCSWCDTPYTWDWKKYDKKMEVMEIGLDARVEQIQQWPCKNLVFTGGEPMLQQPAWVELMEFLKPRNYFFEVETNGTLAIEPAFDSLIDQYNCSPKLKNSGNEKTLRETKYFKGYANNPKAWFKFVVDTPQDLEEVMGWVNTYSLTPDRIFLMPQGKTKKEINVRSKWLAAAAQENGFRFSPRLHIDLWGEKRGV